MAAEARTGFINEELHILPVELLTDYTNIKASLLMHLPIAYHLLVTNKKNRETNVDNGSSVFTIALCEFILQNYNVKSWKTFRALSFRAKL